MMRSNAELTVEFARIEKIASETNDDFRFDLLLSFMDVGKFSLPDRLAQIGRIRDEQVAAIYLCALNWLRRKRNILPSDVLRRAFVNTDKLEVAK